LATIGIDSHAYLCLFDRLPLLLVSWCVRVPSLRLFLVVDLPSARLRLSDSHPFSTHLLPRCPVQTVLSQFRRAPGLPSSSLGLSIVMGTDEEIDWGDVMNRPENSEHQYEPLSEMENRMNGTQKRRVF
jgi:hypothetical protein